MLLRHSWFRARVVIYVVVNLQAESILPKQSFDYPTTVDSFDTNHTMVVKDWALFEARKRMAEQALSPIRVVPRRRPPTPELECLVRCKNIGCFRSVYPSDQAHTIQTTKVAWWNEFCCGCCHADHAARQSEQHQKLPFDSSNGRVEPRKKHTENEPNKRWSLQQQTVGGNSC